MLDEGELRGMYAAKRKERVRFADIRLLDKLWPQHLAKTSPFGQRNGNPFPIPIVTELYERWDEDKNPLALDREDRNIVFHLFMAVLRDSTGITLLDGYDGYHTWKGAVANGWMGSEWKVWTIQFPGDLPYIEKLQLAFYTHWQRIKLMDLLRDEDDTDRCLLQVIKAFQFMIGAIERGRYMTRDLQVLNEEDSSALRKIARTCSFYWTDGNIELLGRTAVALSKNSEELSRFLQDYGHDIDQACDQHRLGLCLRGFDLEFLDFKGVYWKKWWSHESLPVQIVLMFVGMMCARKVGTVWIWEKRWKFVLRQVLGVTRECGNLFRFVWENESRTSLYSLLTQHCCGEGAEIQGGKKGRPMQNTIVYHVGVKVADEIGDVIYPLYRYNSGRELDARTLDNMRCFCLEETRSLLVNKGFMRSRSMARAAELGIAS